MSRNLICLLALGMLAMLVIGCGTTPTPAPPATQPPQIITVIITTTPPPPTATSPLPTNTPVLTPATVESPTTVAVKPTVVGTPRPVATKKPTVPAITPTPSPLPLKYGAPGLIRPIWTDNQKDEAKYPGGAIEFIWKAVGGLGQDECYLLQVNTVPTTAGAGSAKGDYWVICEPNERRADYPVRFVLESPNRGGTQPSYASILPDTEVWAHWSITVVKNLGQCDPGYKYHCKTAPLSPAGKGMFLFKGG